MAAHNSQVAEIFNDTADLLEIEGANEFRIRAYRNAARMIGRLPTPVSDMLRRGEDLSELPGIGKDLAGKIGEIVQSGHLSTLDNLQRKFPKNILELMHVPGLGPKRVRILDRLGINSLEKLRLAIERGKLHRIAGFGRKTEQNLLESLAYQSADHGRVKLFDADQVAASVVAWLRRAVGAQQVVVAGSLRRRRETVRDLDILVTSVKPGLVMDHLIRFEECKNVIAHGETKSTLVLKSGLQVDVRAVPPESYGAALVYFTGSKAHNIELRKIALRQGLKINEYGVFCGEKMIAGRTEADVYNAVGLPFVEPELRENRGELEAAERGELPALVRLEDVRGDLHCHTDASDGRNSLDEMAEAARARGYEYLAITDHSKRLGVTHGLDASRLAKQIDEIDCLNRKLPGLTVLKGVEVDILEDGALDLPASILSRLDIVVASVHSNFHLDKRKQTDRLIRAIENPNCDVIGHPTGRLINERGPANFDIAEVMRAARRHGIALELNAQPDRLDLNDAHCKMAKDFGVLMVISTDAHSVGDLNFIRYGVDQARRGWLTAQNVLNTCARRDIAAAFS